ncbi:MAG: NnrS family protein, partial [Rhodobacter sp.]|nr:NnrS family protein [Rhodobacter sp.]
MNTTAEQMRAWTGPAILSYGFRPFFLGAGLWAGVAMLLWIAMLAGWLSLPTAFDPVSWHAHEFLFGYLGAVSAGFLLTAVPNWTGRLPIVGWPLGGLFALWLLGRAAIGISAVLSPLVVALADLGFPVVLAAVLAREIVAGRNWRNLVVLAMFGILILGNALFHWEAARGDYAAGGAGLRIGLSAGIVMITVIGGRIVPSFTRNWLARQGRPERPAPGDAFDRLVVVCTVAVLLVWVIAPSGRGTALALIFVGILQFWRLGRWTGLRTLSEPLVWSLHVGYGFIPLGALVLG